MDKVRILVGLSILLTGSLLGQEKTFMNSTGYVYDSLAAKSYELAYTAGEDYEITSYEVYSLDHILLEKGYRKEYPTNSNKGKTTLFYSTGQDSVIIDYEKEEIKAYYANGELKYSALSESVNRIELLDFPSEGMETFNGLETQYCVKDGNGYLKEVLPNGKILREGE